ncbi:hypothetical protein BKA18_004090 [Streptomyces auratus]
MWKDAPPSSPYGDSGKVDSRVSLASIDCVMCKRDSKNPSRGKRAVKEPLPRHLRQGCRLTLNRQRRHQGQQLRHCRLRSPSLTCGIPARLVALDGRGTLNASSLRGLPEPPLVPDPLPLLCRPVCGTSSKSSELNERGILLEPHPIGLGALGAVPALHADFVEPAPLDTDPRTPARPRSERAAFTYHRVPVQVDLKRSRYVIENVVNRFDSQVDGARRRCREPHAGDRSTGSQVDLGHRDRAKPRQSARVRRGTGS